MLKTSVVSNHAKRRKQLAANDSKGIFVFHANHHPLRQPDVPYEYRQDSNLFYLTGFEEPESILVMVPRSEGGHESVLFVRDRDELNEIWTGERYGPKRVPKIFGVDSSYPVTEFETRMIEYFVRGESVYYAMGIDPERDQSLVELLGRHATSFGRSGKSFHSIKDSRKLLGEMRLIKDEAEQESMRKAGAASAAAHAHLMTWLRPGVNEQMVQAEVEYQFKTRGCQRNGYGSIVAGGKNACCLHYVENNEDLRDGDLLLIDAGGEVDFYSADITRTYPVGPTFSDAQKRVYELVLAVQKEAVELVKPGVRFIEIHEHVVRRMTQELINWGLLSGGLDQLIENLAYKKFYPHKTGHWLGMDVHDVGLYLDPETDQSVELKPGMVLTIEPGLYFQTFHEGIPEELKGIGVRIEDDILVTTKGYENLTKDVPKDINEIEALRKKAF